MHQVPYSLAIIAFSDHTQNKLFCYGLSSPLARPRKKMLGPPLNQYRVIDKIRKKGLHTHRLCVLH